MNSAKENYEIASMHDAKGEEAEAISYYEKAYKEIDKLSIEDQKGLLLGMGSTYRWINQLDKSQEVFKEAIKRFPDAKEYIVFKSLTDLDLGFEKKAFSQILELLLDETQSEDILKYSRALKYQVELLKNQ